MTDDLTFKEELAHAVQRLFDARPNSAFASVGNAPGHCHDSPPYWDTGNHNAGEVCEWCAAWIDLRKWLPQLQKDSE